jgi:hypothetical protein
MAQNTDQWHNPVNTAMNLESSKGSKDSEKQLRERRMLNGEFVHYLGHFCRLSCTEIVKNIRKNRFRLIFFINNMQDTLNLNSLIRASFEWKLLVWLWTVSQAYLKILLRLEYIIAYETQR